MNEVMVNLINQLKKEISNEQIFITEAEQTNLIDIAAIKQLIKEKAETLQTLTNLCQK
jgi:hypothetical protein